MLTIHLKNGNSINVSNFEKITYFANGSKREKTSENFEEIIIDNAITYKFKGSNLVAIQGSEILYIEIKQD